MKEKNWLFTSESVTEGHPDKLCDAVADAVLDAYLAIDPYSRVACECCTTTGMMVIMGEITSRASVDIQQIARDTIAKIGYTDSAIGFDANSCAILVALDRQSPDIAMGVDNALEGRGEGLFDIGAGDQGMMFGYACDETPELMPLAISLAHRLTHRLAAVRKDGTLPYLRPDGKAQVTMEYEDDRPIRVHTVVLSTQHDPEVSQEQLRNDIKRHVIEPVIDPALLDAQTNYFINPTGRFVIGGPQGDSGLTGRKIIVDTYGGYGRHGGGSFAGKDPTKVDRSAAYMARYVAKNIVASGLARRCEIELAYAIGVAKPVSIHVNTFGTGKLEDARLAQKVAQEFDLRPASIIETLGLRAPIYRPTAAYGHFGRTDVAFPWERTDHLLSHN